MNEAGPPPAETALRRRLTAPLLVLYGLGTTVGAGIYALVGEVAGLAGTPAPVAFLLASALAGFTALSFAELSARHPRSAGEAEYVRQAFGGRSLPLLVGLLVVAAGSVSAATIANGFAGYWSGLVETPRPLAILGVVGLLGGIAAWGIRESVTLAGVVTLIELGGLLTVLAVSHEALASLPARAAELVPAAEPAAWLGIASGAVLAFYAFLGFEDMVNVAEEVRQPRRTLPRAIVATLLLTTLLYVLLATAAVLVVPPQELAASEAPLATVYERASGRSPAPLHGIGVLAMVNGALVQIVMASRVLYGLAGQGNLPAVLGRVSPRTGTPLLATGLVTAVVAVLGLAFPLARLAETTSFITLLVFAMVNGALLRIRRRDTAPPGAPTLPGWVPATGLLASVAVVAFELARLAR